MRSLNFFRTPKLRTAKRVFQPSSTGLEKGRGEGRCVSVQCRLPLKSGLRETRNGGGARPAPVSSAAAEAAALAVRAAGILAIVRRRRNGGGGEIGGGGCADENGRGGIGGDAGGNKIPGLVQ